MNCRSSWKNKNIFIELIKINEEAVKCEKNRNYTMAAILYRKIGKIRFAEICEDILVQRSIKSNLIEIRKAI